MLDTLINQKIYIGLLKNIVMDDIVNEVEYDGYKRQLLDFKQMDGNTFNSTVKIKFNKCNKKIYINAYGMFDENNNMICFENFIEPIDVSELIRGFKIDGNISVNLSGI